MLPSCFATFFSKICYIADDRLDVLLSILFSEALYIKAAAAHLGDGAGQISHGRAELSLEGAFGIGIVLCQLADAGTCIGYRLNEFPSFIIGIAQILEDRIALAVGIVYYAGPGTVQLAA